MDFAIYVFADYELLSHLKEFHFIYDLPFTINVVMEAQ